jgi:hypothetical protein
MRLGAKVDNLFGGWEFTIIAYEPIDLQPIAPAAEKRSSAAIFGTAGDLEENRKHERLYFAECGISRLEMQLREVGTPEKLITGMRFRVSFEMRGTMPTHQWFPAVAGVGGHIVHLVQEKQFAPEVALNRTIHTVRLMVEKAHREFIKQLRRDIYGGKNDHSSQG